MPPKKEVHNPDNCKFECKGVQYKVLVPSCIVPGFNKNKPMTAREICSDATAQQYLVEVAKAFDTVIEEIVSAAPVGDTPPAQ